MVDLDQLSRYEMKLDLLKAPLLGFGWRSGVVAMEEKIGVPAICPPALAAVSETNQSP